MCCDPDIEVRKQAKDVVVELQEKHWSAVTKAKNAGKEVKVREFRPPKIVVWDENGNVAFRHQTYVDFFNLADPKQRTCPPLLLDVPVETLTAAIEDPSILELDQYPMTTTPYDDY